MTITRRWTADEWAAHTANCRPATADDVSITTDGQRLDTKEKWLAFLQEVDRERTRAGVVPPGVAPSRAR
jgi:hypothetical protein